MKKILFFLAVIQIFFNESIFAQDTICPTEMNDAFKNKNFVQLDKYPKSFISTVYHVSCNYYDNGNLEKEEPYLFENDKIITHGIIRAFRENGQLPSPKGNGLLYSKELTNNFRWREWLAPATTAQWCTKYIFLPPRLREQVPKIWNCTNLL